MISLRIVRFIYRNVLTTAKLLPPGLYGNEIFSMFSFLNPLTPNDHYSGRTAPLTSKVAFYIFIQQI